MTDQKKPASRNSFGWTLIVLGVVTALIGALNAKSTSDAVVTFIGVSIIFAALAGLS